MSLSILAWTTVSVRIPDLLCEAVTAAQRCVGDVDDCRLQPFAFPRDDPRGLAALTPVLGDRT